MSTFWTAWFLCQVDQLQPDHIRSLVTDLGSTGFRPPAGDGGFYCTSADGAGSIVLESVEAAAAWLANGEGLLPLQVGESDVSISVHRRDGILHLEMTGLPDEPRFDVVAISTLATRLPREWGAARAALEVSLRVLPFTFAYAMDENAQEALIPWNCVHRRIDEGRMPPFLPWLAAVPEGSILLPQLRKAAEVAGRSLSSISEAWVLTLSDDPSPQSVRTVLRASALWRDETRDAGC